MNNSLRFSVCLLVPTALALSACASIAPPSPMLTHAEIKLRALRTDPTIARWAPNELAQAEQAVKDAQRAYGDPLHIQHLAFMAENQVEIAKATANANREESAYEALLAKRNTMGGGNDSITTLAQDAIGDNAGRATPINQKAETEAFAANESTPLPAPTPAVSAANDTLLTMHASDFGHDNHLTTTAHNAVHGLLASLARQPWRRVVISGASNAQLAAVRKALAENGVPGWRLQTRRTTDHAISIAFRSVVSTPAIQR